MISDIIEVRFISEKKGRGLFAKKDILKGTILDKCELLLIPEKDYKIIKKTKVEEYIFEWDEFKDENSLTSAFLLSPMELMNHSYTNNVEYDLLKDDRVIVFKTIKDIKKGEELTTDYNCGETGKDVVWFDVEE